MVSDTGVVVATVDHGVVGTPRLLLPTAAAQLAWSNDSTHLAIVTTSGSNDYLLTVVDTLAVPTLSTTVSAVNGYYLLQP